jgi:hypothetical protein
MRKEVRIKEIRNEWIVGELGSVLVTRTTMQMEEYRQSCQVSIGLLSWSYARCFQVQYADTTTSADQRCSLVRTTTLDTWFMYPQGLLREPWNVLYNRQRLENYLYRKLSLEVNATLERLTHAICRKRNSSTANKRYLCSSWFTFAPMKFQLLSTLCRATYCKKQHLDVQGGG